MEKRLYFNFETLWNRYEDLELPETEPKSCPYAKIFAEWADELCNVTKEPDIVSVNQAKILLLDKYFEWYNAVPKKHRQRIGDRGHICLYQVFMRSYERLRQAELEITPPMLFIPPPPPTPPSRPLPDEPVLWLGPIDE